MVVRRSASQFTIHDAERRATLGDSALRNLSDALAAIPTSSLLNSKRRRTMFSEVTFSEWLVLFRCGCVSHPSDARPGGHDWARRT